MAKHVGGGVSRRQQILTAVNDLVRRHGRVPSVAEVARAVGISHVGVLHHFTTRDELVVRVVAEQQGNCALSWTPVHEAGGLNAMSHLPALLEPIFGDRAHLRLLSAAVDAHLDTGANETSGFLLRQLLDDRRDTITTMVTIGIERGEIRSDVSPKSVAEEVVALVYGLGSLSLMDAKMDEVQDTFVSYLQALLHRIATPETAVPHVVPVAMIVLGSVEDESVSVA
jgi:AcrR family transcriptional regulator